MSVSDERLAEIEATPWDRLTERDYRDLVAALRAKQGKVEQYQAGLTRLASTVAR